MKRGVQSAVAVALVASILVIVYSPFVDLPLTETAAKHSPIQPLHVLPAPPITVADEVRLWLGAAPREAIVPVSEVVAITCAYLC